MALRIERYGRTRFWALWDGNELVTVTVYTKGAQEVQRRLEALPPQPWGQILQARAQAAAVEQAHALAAQARALARQARQLAGERSTR